MVAPVSGLAVVHDIIRCADLPGSIKLLAVVGCVTGGHLRHKLQRLRSPVSPDSVACSLVMIPVGVTIRRSRRS